jgi:hypothetical protein
MPTSPHAAELVGEVDVKMGAAAVPSKTALVFTIAATRVAAPGARTR